MRKYKQSRAKEIGIAEQAIEFTGINRVVKVASLRMPDRSQGGEVKNN